MKSVLSKIKIIFESVFNSSSGGGSMNLVLLGGPGSGKGTQAEKIQNQFGVLHLSTGELFRENIKNQTELGTLAKSFMDKGDLVPDEVTVGMVRERMKDSETEAGVLFDGFPRTIAQAEALDDLMSQLTREITMVLNLTVSDEEIVRRLSGRLICKKCELPFHKEFNPFQTCPYEKCEGEQLYQRDDDRPETVRARLLVFQEQTAPLIDYYSSQSKLVTVAGEGGVDKVFESIREVLEGQ
jgi:adenylate kinase